MSYFDFVNHSLIQPLVLPSSYLDRMDITSNVYNNKHNVYIYIYIYIHTVLAEEVSIWTMIDSFYRYDGDCAYPSFWLPSASSL